ncbi:DUF6461 domain-containing protein [Streptomyces sp. NPDC017201]|uniref:DUF6461 domain-containing protein n=1 Tax=unclassified Streptomyces TaxID=2593676 RepID=UPI00379D8716
MTGSWRLENSGHFCLTLSLNKSPEEVMEIYGADASNARLMPAKEVPSVPPSGTSLRSGRLGEWSFGIEFDNFIGSTYKIMRDLSERTESIILFRTAKALKSFHYVTNGKVAEQFDPGYLPSIRGKSSYRFAEQVHVLTATNLDPVAACLRVIARRTGHELTTEKIHGPLLTAIIDEPDRVALSHPDPPLLLPGVPRESSRRLGRLL